MLNQSAKPQEYSRWTLDADEKLGGFFQSSVIFIAWGNKRCLDQVYDNFFHLFTYIVYLHDLYFDIHFFSSVK